MRRTPSPRLHAYSWKSEVFFFFARLRHVFSAVSHFCTRFIIPGDVDLDDAPYEDFLPHDEELGRQEERESSRRGELMAKVHFSR